MGDPVQLPAIGGGATLMNTAAATPAAGATKPAVPDRSSVVQGNPYSKISPYPNPRVVSHQGVLESQGHSRGRGDRREKQSRENSRERSRRCDRSGKEEARKGGPAAVGAIENEPKKLKKEHDRKSEDELMDAQGPSVYDLTQHDDDGDDDEAPKEKLVLVWDRTNTLTSNMKMMPSLHPRLRLPLRPLHHCITWSTSNCKCNNNNLQHCHHHGSVTFLIPWLPCIRNKTARTLTSSNSVLRLGIKA